MNYINTYNEVLIRVSRGGEFIVLSAPDDIWDILNQKAKYTFLNIPTEPGFFRCVVDCYHADGHCEGQPCPSEEKWELYVAEFYEEI